MAASSRRRGGQPLSAVHRFVLETLEAFASAEMSDRILETALDWAHEDAVPNGGERLSRFVERDLALAARESLGSDVAVTITDALRPMVRMLPDADDKSRVRTRQQQLVAPEPQERPLRWSATPPSSTAKPPAPASTVPPPELVAREPSSERPTATPPELALPMVILATRGEEREAGITRWLGERAALQVVHDAVHLLECVAVAMNLAPVIVVDCLVPAVQLETLFMLTGDLPKGATVVLWGISDEVELDAFAVDHGAGLFIRAGVEADARDVGALLTPFIDR